MSNLMCIFSDLPYTGSDVIIYTIIETIMFLGLTFGSYFLKFGSDFGLIFYFWKVLGTLYQPTKLTLFSVISVLISMTSYDVINYIFYKSIDFSQTC